MTPQDVLGVMIVAIGCLAIFFVLGFCIMSTIIKRRCRGVKDG